jgi:cephalosporin hydroxylase
MCCGKKPKPKLMNKETVVIESQKMGGWCTAEKADRLYDLVLNSDSKLTVELGVFMGRSLIVMAQAHKAKQSGVIIGVDAWSKQAALEGTNEKANDEWWGKLDYRQTHESVSKDIFKHEVEEYCSILKMTSETFGLMIADNTIDVLHADSNHSEEVTTREIELFYPKLKSGGFWVADDCDWPTLKKAVEILKEKMNVYFDGGTYIIFQKK